MRRAQHFDGERRNQRAVDAGGERNAPDDAAFGIDRDEAASRTPRGRARRCSSARRDSARALGGAAVPRPHRSPRASCTVNGGARSAMPVGSGRARRRRAPRSAAASARASTASLDGRPDSASASAVSPGSARASSRSGDSASASGIRMSSAMAAGCSRRIAVHELRHHGARPWPLADRRQALLVDLDDGHRLDAGIRGAMP